MAKRPRDLDRPDGRGIDCSDIRIDSQWVHFVYLYASTIPMKGKVFGDFS
jgi:hypothetical protein